MITIQSPVAQRHFYHPIYYYLLLFHLIILSIGRITQRRILGQWTVNLSGFERQYLSQKWSYCQYISEEERERERARKGEGCRVIHQARTDKRWRYRSRRWKRVGDQCLTHAALSQRKNHRTHFRSWVFLVALLGTCRKYRPLLGSNTQPSSP
jgi:hypothetical protein